MSSSTHHLLLSILFSYVLVTSKAHTQLEPKGGNFSLSAILVFGDSTVDAGNNNKLWTIFKCNFPPYGNDFPNHKPTGRYTNGRLITDFIASYVGIKETVPAYLDPSISINDLKTGVSFASGSSGYDPITAKLANVLSMSKQLDYLKEYKTKVEEAIGKDKIKDHMKKAISVVSAGTNDFVVNYYGAEFQRLRYNVTQYEQVVLQDAQKFYQGLWDLGARRISVSGLPPMGCLPIVITVRKAFQHRSCDEKLNSLARDYNQKLQNLLANMNKGFKKQGGLIFYMDIFTPLQDMISQPAKYGFQERWKGCCGTGLVEGSFLCNRDSSVCPDASKYIFWDSIHPTEKAYYNLLDYFRPVIDRFLKN